MEKQAIGMHTCVQVDTSGAIKIPSMFFTALGKDLTGGAVWAHYDEPGDPAEREAWGGEILVKPQLTEFESFEIDRCAICPITKTIVANAHGTNVYGRIFIPLPFWEKLGLGESRWVSLELTSQYITPSARQMEIVIRLPEEAEM